MYGRFEFQPEKAVEAILYIAEQLDQATFHSVSKTCYFADLIHLQNYGRLITGDNYVAMKHGPVPSRTYDLMKEVRGDRRSELSVILRSAFNVADGRRIIPLRKANTDMLSQSDRQALDEAIKKCRGMSFGQLTNASHDAAWHAADENEFISLDAMINMLPNADEIREFVNAPIPD